MTGYAVSLMMGLQHDLLIYAPLVLFVLCPLLILLGAALPPLRGRPYRLAALLVLGLGTASLFVAIPCPTNVDPLVTGSPTFAAIHWICRNLVTETHIIFLGLTAIYVGVILLPELLRRRDNRLFSTVLPLSFLVLYSAGAVFLMQTTGSAAGLTQRTGIGVPVAEPSHGRQAAAQER